MRATLVLLEKDEASLAEVARGTGIPESWLWRFASNRIKDPGVNRVERLYAFLSGDRLTVRGA